MNNKTKAILFIIICTITSDLGILITKYVLLKDFSVSQIILMRTCLRTIPLFFIIPFVSNFTFKTNIAWNHFLRCFFGAISVFILTYGSQYISISEATVINYIVPVFMSVLCWHFLKEEMTYFKMMAIGLSFFGVLISINLNPSSPGLISLLMLFGAFISACHRLYVKKVSEVDSPLLGNIYLNSFLILITIPSIFTGNWSSITLAYIPFLLLWGGLSFITQYLSSKALSICEGSVLAPFDYISFATVFILEYLTQGILPGWNVVFGAVIITFANIYYFRKEVRA